MDVSGEISTQKCEITKKTDPKIVPRATPACAPRIACHSLRIACHSLGDRPKAGRRPAREPSKTGGPRRSGSQESSTIPPRFLHGFGEKHKENMKENGAPSREPNQRSGGRRGPCRRETVTKPSPNRHVTVTLLAQKHKENMKDSQQKKGVPWRSGTATVDAKDTW